MATSKMSLGLMTGPPRRSSAINYSPVSTNDLTAIDDAEHAARLRSTGDVSISVSVPSLGHHHCQQPLRHRTASSSVDAGPQRDQESLTQSVSDVLSAGADEVLNRRRDRKSSMRVLLQTKIYNFLERPTGCRCFLYHFCVYVHFAFTSI